MNIVQIIGLIIGLFAIIATISKFFKFIQEEIKKRIAIHDNLEMIKYFQKRTLETWKLFDFLPDINMKEIYVQEKMLDRDESMGLPMQDEEIYKKLYDDIKNGMHINSITGRAGSGKSTMLRNWALRLINEESKPIKYRKRTLTPVFLSLRNINNLKEYQENKEITIDILAKCFANTIPGIDFEIAKFPFSKIQASALHEAKNIKKYPQWILFFDGLDEVTDIIRNQIINFLHGLPYSYRVVLSMRPETLFQYPKHSKVYDMCDFNDAQIKNFIDQWFFSNTDIASKLFSHITTNDSLHKIATNPLLLTFLCIDVKIRNSAEFPEKLIETNLLKRIVEIIMEEWDANKEGRTINNDLLKLGNDLFSEIVKERAEFLFNKEEKPNFNYASYLFKYDELKSKLSSLSIKYNVSNENSIHFLERIISGKLLLIGNKDSYLSFNHSIFLDYFLAKSLKNEINLKQ